MFEDEAQFSVICLGFGEIRLTLAIGLRLRGSSSAGAFGSKPRP
jgi:hypothetical protein